MELNTLYIPVYTSLTVACLILIQVVLMVSVIKMRGDLGILIGSGDNEALKQRIRAHGNFIENVPTFMIGLVLIELLMGSTLWVAILGAIVVLARLAHAFALTSSSGVTAGRLLGTLGTAIPMLVVAGYLVYFIGNPF